MWCALSYHNGVHTKPHVMKFQNKYRIVRDNYAGYEAQYQLWWLPFIWLQCDVQDGINTCSSIEHAEQVCKQHAMNRRVVKEYDPYSDF